MEKSFRRGALIIFFDLLIALFSFWISRYFGNLPRWYWLVLSSVVWVVIGLLTNKLRFSQYKRIRYLVGGLLFIDIITGGMLFLSYRYLIDGYSYDYSILLATGLIFVLECVLYYILRIIYYHKIPYFYEEPIPNIAVEKIKDVDVKKSLNSDINAIIDAIKTDVPNPTTIISTLKSDTTVVVDTSDPEHVLQIDVESPSLIVHEKTLNNIRHINTLLAFTNDKLADSGYVVCKCTTSGIRHYKIIHQLPRIVGSIAYFIDFVLHRVIPKLSYFNKLYYFITKGERRVLTRVEILGRLYRAGFEVVCEKIVSDNLYVVAQKIQEPIRHDKPSNGILIRLKRSGKDGKKIGVYKFRTMYAYSEYLQPYIYKTEGLTEDSARYNNDYRISPLGMFMRKVFIDELPMLLNWFKGDIKLVGVRPLSDHYLSLYNEGLKELRLKVKPGLIPPFYVDKPNSIEEKQESERRYIEAYLKNPISTDWNYFWRIFYSIVFKGTRSE